MTPNHGHQVRRLATLVLAVPVLAVALALVPISSAPAAPGDVDPFFGDAAGAYTDFGGGTEDEGRAVVVQSDGKIVVAGVSGPTSTGGDFALARYNPDGSLDTTFSADGKVTTSFGGTPQSTAVATDVAVQTDGKIVAVGIFRASDGFIVVRYNSNGSLDTSFDTDGKVVTDLGGLSGTVSVAIQADGRIVAGGGRAIGASSDFAVVRYNANGSLDTTFDTDGKVITDFGDDDSALDVAIQTDGRIVAAGQSGEVGLSDFAAARYNPNGSLDTTFDTDGKTVTDFGGDDFGTEVAIQADGRIVAAGGTATPGVTDFALARYTTSGALDPTFDGDGRVVTPFAGLARVSGLAIQAGGKIVAVGNMSSADRTNHFVLARYNSNGSLDPTFDVDGRVVTELTAEFGPASSSADALAIQPDGNLVVAGHAIFSSARARDFAVLRYVTGGEPTPAGSHDFDGDGTADMAVWRPSDGTWYVRSSSLGFNHYVAQQWGRNGDLPLLDSDFDGDRRADLVVWRPSNATWYVRTSSTEFRGLFFRQWGLNGDVPLANSDFDGDDKADLAVWRPSNGTWYVRTSSSAFAAVVVRQWGLNGDVPLANSDFDGDGAADMALWRPSNGTWYVRTSSSAFAAVVVRQWGLNGDVPLANSDFDGDGAADMALWRPSNGTWYVRTSSSAFDGFIVRQWGLTGDVPLANSDFDGDDAADMALWRPSNGTWYVRTSSSAFDNFTVRQWGQSGDIPLANSDFTGDAAADTAVWRPSNGTWYVKTEAGPEDFLVREWGRLGDVLVAGR
jgi:uncharacterized delta-60 repeat protein